MIGFRSGNLKVETARFDVVFTGRTSVGKTVVQPKQTRMAGHYPGKHNHWLCVCVCVCMYTRTQRKREHKMPFTERSV